MTPPPSVTFEEAATDKPMPMTSSTISTLEPDAGLIMIPPKPCCSCGNMTTSGRSGGVLHIMSCKHMLHMSCMLRYFTLNSNDGKDVKPLKCPVTGCEHIITTAIQNSLLTVRDAVREKSESELKRLAKRHRKELTRAERRGNKYKYLLQSMIKSCNAHISISNARAVVLAEHKKRERFNASRRVVASSSSSSDDDDDDDDDDDEEKEKKRPKIGVLKKSSSEEEKKKEKE